MTRWSTEQANTWYAQQPWLVGCNYIPSTAINQLEMWQTDSFDPDTIDRELGWAADLGFNALRVYLHDLAWVDDAAGFKTCIARYLDIAVRHGLRTMFVFFDDCWNGDPFTGPQPQPTPGVHNSGWWQSPGARVVLDPTQWPRLEDYVVDVVDSFAHDPRILMWDVYNEPGNQHMGAKSLPLLQQVFAWVRSARPSQPLTAGIWHDYPDLNAAQLAASDIVTFHNYDDAGSLKRQIDDLRAYGRPLICTEYMARTRGSAFATHLPIFRAERVGCLNWGLVSGKTQTRYPWGWADAEVEPEVWFHDIFYADGRPYRRDEVNTICHIIRDAPPRTEAESAENIA
jgi:hypothetical protein